MNFVGWRWRVLGVLAAGLCLGGPVWAHDEHETLPPARPAQQAPPTDSIYQVDSIWTDQEGARVALASLAGKPRVVAMVYTSCQFVCPLIVDEMKRIERALSADQRTHVGFDLFSFDPERDTVAVLKAYAIKRDLDPARWRLYTGKPDEILELAAVLGVRYRKEPDGEFSHSTIITVLDRRGVIRHQMQGLKQDRVALLQALRRALDEPPRR